MISSYIEAVGLALNGNNEGFTYLYENTYYDKYYMALKYMGNEEDAQDVLQDAYMSAWNKLSTIREPEKFPNWLGLIVANTAKNALKRKKPVLFSELSFDDGEGNYCEYDVEDDYIGAQPEVNYTIQETQQFLYEMLESLSEEQKMCILMYHIEDMKIKDIAQALEISENTVKSRLTYGRNALRAKCDEMQKKGYRLYSVAPIPFLLYLVGMESRAYYASGVAASAIARCYATNYVYAAMANNSTASSAVSTANNSAASSGVRMANNSTASSAVSTANVSQGNVAGKSLAAKGANSLVTKLAVAIVCSVIVISGVIILISVLVKNKKSENNVNADIITEITGLTEAKNTEAETAINTEVNTEENTKTETSENTSESTDTETEVSTEEKKEEDNYYDLSYLYGLPNPVYINIRSKLIEKGEPDENDIVIDRYELQLEEIEGGFLIEISSINYTISMTSDQYNNCTEENIVAGETFTLVSEEYNENGRPTKEFVGEDGATYMHSNDIMGPFDDFTGMEYFELYGDNYKRTVKLDEGTKIFIPYGTEMDEMLKDRAANREFSGGNPTGILKIQFDQDGNIVKSQYQ